jgi:hypothetical protein
MSKAVEALTTMAEISNRQTAQVVELAIAFGASLQFETGADTAAILEYSTSDVTEFLKRYSVRAYEEGGKTLIEVTRREQGA